MAGDNDDFDIGAAVDSIGSGLGFESKPDDDDVHLEVDPPKSGDATSTPAPADGAAKAGASTPPAEGAAKPAAEGAPTDGTAAPAADPTTTPPRTWRPEAAAAWNALPPEVKAEIHKRESDIFKGIEAYRGDANIGKAIRAAVDPYAEFLNKAGLAPMDAITGLLQSHHTLATGTPEQKLALFQSMAKSYGINLQGQASPDQAPYVDPAVADLQKQLQQVNSQLSEVQRARMDQTRAGVKSEVDAFASDPANSYFDEVSNEVAQLLQRGLATTLREAYDKAIWINPVVRAKVVVAQQKAQAEQAAAQVEKARQASAANVKARARSGSAATPLGTLDDTIAATLADIKSRS